MFIAEGYVFFRAAHVFATPPPCSVYSIQCILALRQPTARREVREINDCAESELVNHLTPEVRPFPRERLKLFMTCSMRTYLQFIYDCSCIETDTGRPAYSEPLSLHKNYIKNQDTTYLTSAHITLSRRSSE